ncbi:MAG: ABC transporter ATP-binding protein [Proteobacteria bacterium]|nr:ABC transporter ATP-binding protein [Pseudomonadota bacterium]
MTLLQVEDLSVTLNTANGPVTIIDRIDFEMAAGEKLGIVGESGCGKSITALALMSLLPEKSSIDGRIVFKGRNLPDLKPGQMRDIRGNRMAMIFQEPMTALNPVRTIGSQISESLLLHMKIGRKELKNRVMELMENVGLSVERFPLNLYPHQLSGGQRQRVMIAMAIACKPDLLIADEPTTALDVTVQEQILDLIQDLVEEQAMALIMISHDLGVIAQTTDQVAVMYTGKVVERGGTVDVYRNATHPYTQGLFAAIPHVGSSLSGERKRLFSIPGQVPEPHLRPEGCCFVERCSRATVECGGEEPPRKFVNETHQVRCCHPITDEDQPQWEKRS